MEHVKPEPWITAKEAAQHLGFAVGTMYNMAAANEIPHRKLGRALRFRVSELDAWIEARDKGEA
jgi:excisionase family DNA binding protein